MGAVHYANGRTSLKEHNYSTFGFGWPRDLYGFRDGFLRSDSGLDFLTDVLMGDIDSASSVWDDFSREFNVSRDDLIQATRDLTRQMGRTLGESFRQDVRSISSGQLASKVGSNRYDVIDAYHQAFIAQVDEWVAAGVVSDDTSMLKWHTLWTEFEGTPRYQALSSLKEDNVSDQLYWINDYTSWLQGTGYHITTTNTGDEPNTKQLFAVLTPQNAPFHKVWVSFVWNLPGYSGMYSSVDTGYPEIGVFLDGPPTIDGQLMGVYGWASPDDALEILQAIDAWDLSTLKEKLKYNLGPALRGLEENKSPRITEDEDEDRDREEYDLGFDLGFWSATGGDSFEEPYGSAKFTMGFTDGFQTARGNMNSGVTEGTLNEDVGILKYFIGKSQLAAMEQGARGPEKEYFLAKMREMESLVQAMPRIYAQDGKGDAAIAYLHYFRGGMDFYITERDTTDEQYQAFGLADIGYGPELGYISIQELIDNGVELDLHFMPRAIKTLKESNLSEGNYYLAREVANATQDLSTYEETGSLYTVYWPDLDTGQEHEQMFQFFDDAESFATRKWEKLLERTLITLDNDWSVYIRMTPLSGSYGETVLGSGGVIVWHGNSEWAGKQNEDTVTVLESNRIRESRQTKVVNLDVKLYTDDYTYPSQEEIKHAVETVLTTDKWLRGYLDQYSISVNNIDQNKYAVSISFSAPSLDTYGDDTFEYVDLDEITANQVAATMELSLQSWLPLSVERVSVNPLSESRQNEDTVLEGKVNTGYGVIDDCTYVVSGDWNYSDIEPLTYYTYQDALAGFYGVVESFREKGGNVWYVELHAVLSTPGENGSKPYLIHRINAYNEQMNPGSVERGGRQWEIVESKQSLHEMNVDLMNQVRDGVIKFCNENGINLHDHFASVDDFQQFLIHLVIKTGMDTGLSTPEAVDLVFGPGGYDQLSQSVWDSLQEQEGYENLTTRTYSRPNIEDPVMLSNEAQDIITDAGNAALQSLGELLPDSQVEMFDLRYSTETQSLCGTNREVRSVYAICC